MLIKSKGKYPKAWIAALIGGAIAFSLYYLMPLLPYLGSFIDIVFFQLETMLFQVPAVSAEKFIVNFGVILFLAFFGIILTFFKLRKSGNLGFYLLLSLAFYIPLFFSQSYLVGIYLPYQRFVYYLLPSIAVFSAVSFVFIIDRLLKFNNKFEKRWKKNRIKIITYPIIILLISLFIFRFGIVYGKIMEASVFYSTSDVKGYDAAIWLRDNYPEPTTVVVTEVPGSWFGVYSGKSIFAETDPIVDRNVIAESVLELAYELEHPLTLVRTYESKGAISGENYVSINSVWKRVSYSSGAGDFLSYKINGEEHVSELHRLNREIIFEDQSYPKKMSIHYFNEELNLIQTIQFQNNSYPINVSWILSSNNVELTEVKLYVSTFFDLSFSFTKAYVPGVLFWENPWDKPSDSKNNEWAVTNFTRNNLTENLISIYDEKDKIVFAIKFDVLPEWGNLGALSSKQIDALRFQYEFNKVEINQTISRNFDIMSFSRNDYSEMQDLSELISLFDSKLVSEHDVLSRDYHTYIKDNNIEFIVYDKNQLDTKLVNSKLLTLVYSNDRYAIFKIKK